MLATWVVVGASAAYVGLLFAIAYYGDRRADRGRSIIGSGYIYALSIAVYATTWTYYGSVGRAASTGLGFLPIYLGPTVMAALWWLVLRKIIRVSRQNRITSLADFVSARYGNSALLGALVAVIAVVGIVPYIALQLKAVSNTFNVLISPDLPSAATVDEAPLLYDTALYLALLLAAFAIVFGARHLDAAERHEGMVAAIAFESLVKLVVFLTAGCYVTFVIFAGVGDLVDRAATRPDVARLFSFEATGSYGSWLWLTVLSMFAVLLLPRQWQMAVVENVDERHVKPAAWLFPLYLLLINLFVLPVAIAGLLTFGSAADADAFLLTLPLVAEQPWLALLVFLGGLSAATGMVIVESVALATMVSNSLVGPVLLRPGAAVARRLDLGRLILRIRRATIVGLLLLGYGYFRVAGETLSLVSIGLISFAAVAQFAPAILGGLFWRGATRAGALAGLIAGFLVWAYTLALPTLVESGWLPPSFPRDGPFGWRLLAPHGLLGLTGLDPVTHALLWSTIANVGLFVGLSLTGRRDPAEQVQATVFVDAFARPREGGDAGFRRGTVTVGELQGLLARFLGPDRAREALSARAGADLTPESPAGPELIHHVETLLAGAVGSTSARIMVASVVEEEPLRTQQVMELIDETSQVLAYSRLLEQKSRELEAATTELRDANERLKELDRLKDDFVATISHELRTPLTSIRAFAEILLDNPDLDADERAGYLRIVVDETERLSRLINQVLDLSKLESGGAQWRIEPIDLRELVEISVQATSQLFRDKRVALELDLAERVPPVAGDRDRLVQVVINLLSNAVKFCEPDEGRVRIVLASRDGVIRVDVRDNGPGIAPADQNVIFEKFRQGGDAHTNRPPGTGLGLPISRKIIDHLGGRLWVRSEPGEGATFSFTLPVAAAGSAAAVTAGTEGR